MDHTYVEEHDLLEAYLAERLSEGERDAFEAHYFSCEICLERLETTDGFREGMRRVAAEDLAQAVAVRAQLGFLAGLAGLAALSRRRRFALAGAVLLVAALPAAWLLESNRRLERQLAESAAGAEDQRSALEARLLSLERAGADDRQRLTEELTRERQARATTPQLAEPELARPEINVPLFVLAAVRSDESGGREPVSQLPLASGARSVILTAELATVDYPAYRAVLRTADGRDIWQAQSLHPDSRDTPILLLPASMLQPGSYRLTIEGAQKNRKVFPVAAYPFRIVRRP